MKPMWNGWERNGWKNMISHSWKKTRTVVGCAEFASNFTLFPDPVLPQHQLLGSQGLTNTYGYYWDPYPPKRRRVCLTPATASSAFWPSPTHPIISDRVGLRIHPFVSAVQHDDPLLVGHEAALACRYSRQTYTQVDPPNSWPWQGLLLSSRGDNYKRSKCAERAARRDRRTWNGLRSGQSSSSAASWYHRHVLPYLLFSELRYLFASSKHLEVFFVWHQILKHLGVDTSSRRRRSGDTPSPYIPLHATLAFPSYKISPKSSTSSSSCYELLFP